MNFGPLEAVAAFWGAAIFPRIHQKGPCFESDAKVATATRPSPTEAEKRAKTKEKGKGAKQRIGTATNEIPFEPPAVSFRR